MDRNTFLKTLESRLVEYGCGNEDLERIYAKIQSRVPDKIEVENSMNDLVVQVLSSDCHRFQTYDNLAVRFLSQQLEDVAPSSFLEVVEKIQQNRNLNGDPKPLFSEEFYDFIRKNAEKVEAVFQEVLGETTHFPVSTFGWKTLFRSYLTRTHEGVMERPDHLWYRVALFLHRDDWTRVRSSFAGLRQGHFIHATPTLFSAGMARSQMASCFSASTPVLTSRGLYPIAEVQVGDLVLTHTNQWKPVLQTHANDRDGRDMFRLQFHNRPAIEATLDHPFFVYVPSVKKYLWKTVAELRPGDWVAEGDGAPERHLPRHVVRGILYSLTNCSTALIRGSQWTAVSKLFIDHHVRFIVLGRVNPGDNVTVRVENIKRWLPIDLCEEYPLLERDAFLHFLRGVRYTGFYNHVLEEYSFRQDLADLASIKGLATSRSSTGGLRIREPLGCMGWMERSLKGDRPAVRLWSKTLLKNPGETVYTLGVQDDHSYVAGGVVAKNCFLVGTEDSVQGIYQTLADAAQISKWAGGLGIHVSEVRGKNSYIYGTNGTSNGILPMLKVYNNTARYIDQCFSGNTPVLTEGGWKCIRQLVPHHDRVLTKGGTLELVTKKLVYPLPSKELVQVTVRTPWDARLEIVMSREHTVQYQNRHNEKVMVALEDGGFGWKTTYAPLVRPLHETPYSVEECFVLGYLYKNLVEISAVRYSLTLACLNGTQKQWVRDFLHAHYSRCVRHLTDDNLEILLDSPARLRLPEPVDYSSLKVYPSYWHFVTPYEKAASFLEGWNVTEAVKLDPFWMTYRGINPEKKMGTIESVRAVALEEEPRLVYDLEVANDPSYQTALGIVHNGGGKRNGAFAMYLEPWHSDILSFLEARRNTGSEEERARDLFYALWIPDLFMRYVEEGRDWYLMSPSESPGLANVWGGAFETLYLQYVEKGKYIQKVSARDIWREITRSQLETGTPYMLYKDSCNRRSNQQNLGTIRSSNLCCEIIQYSDANEYAVCNLASIALPRCLRPRVVRETLWVYGRDDCVYCKMLKGVLAENGISYEYRDASSSLTEEEAPRVVDGRSLPIVFSGSDEYVGGFDEAWARYLCPEFDFERLGSIVEQLVENLNIVIDKNAYPLEKCRVSNMRHRPLGIGVQGLADVYFQMLLPYDSPKARQLNAEIFECLYFHALTASQRLAVQDGAYSTFAGSPLSRGKFHFELLGPSQTPRLSGKWDWETLRPKIVETGTRNSLMVAPMPTASTSQILGNTESFEPLTSNLYLRRTSAGEFYVCNEMLRRVLHWLGRWDNDMIEKLVIFKGSVQNLSVLPKPLREVFRTVWEISQKSLIDMAADRQHFIDQSQSFNIHLEDATMEKLNKVHFYGWKKGLKTGSYYVRTRAPISSQNFTIDPLKEKECLSCSA